MLGAMLDALRRFKVRNIWVMCLSHPLIGNHQATQQNMRWCYSLLFGLPDLLCFINACLVELIPMCSHSHKWLSWIHFEPLYRAHSSLVLYPLLPTSAPSLRSTLSPTIQAPTFSLVCHECSSHPSQLPPLNTDSHNLTLWKTARETGPSGQCTWSFVASKTPKKNRGIWCRAWCWFLDWSDFWFGGSSTLVLLFRGAFLCLIWIRKKIAYILCHEARKRIEMAHIICLD